jgi:hypothetical protein
MISSLAIPSNCQFLFGKEAEEIYKNIKVPKGMDKKTFIERCLDLTMKAHTYLFAHHDGILLLDPRAYNKQCQLYALRACQINGRYKQLPESEKMNKNEENRFLHLGFFINYAFREPENYVNTVLSTLHRMRICPENEVALRHFVQFLRDGDKCRAFAARTAFNQVFEMNIKASLSKIQGESPLCKELAQLAQEDLQVDGTSLSDKMGKLYTYPKLPGLSYMLQTMAQEKISMVFKIKVCTKDGCGGMVSQSSGPVDKDSSVVVFTGFATDGSFSVKDCMDQAKRCPTYLYRNHSDPTERHASHDKCFYCTPIEMDLQPYQEHLNKVMAASQEVLLALGSEFMYKEQQSLLQFFKDSKKYPLLSKMYEDNLDKVKMLELGNKTMRTFAIYHTISETGRNAASNEFPLDLNPEAFLKSREMIVPIPKVTLLDDFLREKGLDKLSRAERKAALASDEQTLRDRGFMIKSKRERFPKNKGHVKPKILAKLKRH